LATLIYIDGRAEEISAPFKRTRRARWFYFCRNSAGLSGLYWLECWCLAYTPQFSTGRRLNGQHGFGSVRSFTCSSSQFWTPS